MAAKIDPLMTIDDLDAMPEDGNRYEVIEGELFVSRAPGLPHQVVSGNILYEVRKYLDKDPRGTIVATPGLILSQYSGVIPDLVFFSHERGKEIIANECLIAAPELVIEILSRGRENIARDRTAKRQLYARHGVSEYWIVDAENRAVEVYRLARGTLDLASILRAGDEIGSRALPGFKCLVSDFFRT